MRGPWGIHYIKTLVYSTNRLPCCWRKSKINLCTGEHFPGKFADAISFVNILYTLLDENILLKNVSSKQRDDYVGNPLALFLGVINIPKSLI
jgi:hypothetical protein